MNNQTLSHAIDLTNEIAVLDDILDAANNQPYLEFSFFYSATGKNHTYAIKNEALVHQILVVIADRKIDLEKEFEKL